MVRRPGPPREGAILRMHVTYTSRPGGVSGEAPRGSITTEGASYTTKRDISGLRYVRSSGDGGRENCSSHPSPEEDDKVTTQRTSLRDT